MRTLQVEAEVQGLGLMTQGIQASLDSVFHTTWATQQATLNQLLTYLRDLQEIQGRAQLALRDIDTGVTGLRESTSQALSRQAPSDPVTPYGKTTNITALLSSNQSMPIIGFKVRQATVSLCPQGCFCRCHTHDRWNSPRPLRCIIGALFIGYSRTPTLAPRCNRAACGRHQQSLITVIYVFPSWLLQRILLAVLRRDKRDGPIVSLRAIQTRSSHFPGFYYAESGNLMGLQSLLKNNEASPLDVEATSDECLPAVCPDVNVVTIKLSKSIVCGKIHES